MYSSTFSSISLLQKQILLYTVSKGIPEQHWHIPLPNSAQFFRQSLSFTEGTITMQYFSYIPSPLGTLLITEEQNAITRLSLSSEETLLMQFPAGSMKEQETPLISTAKQQLAEYFQGTRKNFSLPLAPFGTPFQHKVWDALCTIPYGETRSYKEIAIQVGNPKGYRAVGMANNRNPIMVIVPCHRVIGSNGALVGYAGGLGIKEWLLEHEKNH